MHQVFFGGFPSALRFQKSNKFPQAEPSLEPWLSVERKFCVHHAGPPLYLSLHIFGRLGRTFGRYEVEHTSAVFAVCML